VALPAEPDVVAGAQLPDGNVLVALVSPSHVHHAAAERWFAGTDLAFATCPITQGTLLRLLMQLGPLPTEVALATLQQLVAHPRHRFWPDALAYPAVSWRGVMGHRQVTDAYLAALARHFQGRLVTFDRGLHALHDDVTVLLPAS
jgi:toxin-antitoxin system PIN domain toxin